MLSGELPRLLLAAWREQGKGREEAELRFDSIDLPGDRDLLRDLDKVEAKLPPRLLFSATIAAAALVEMDAASLLTTASVRFRSRLAFRRTVPICSRSLASGIQKWCLL